MNTTTVSKVSLPSETFLNCYYYFTSFVLCLTLFITPTSFYIILTQSKNLKSFKWFVLNHLFWSFVLELFLGLMKPVFLPPASAVFALGFFRENGSFEKTMILLFSGVCAAINYNASFVATIANRYLTTFPSPWTDWITKKLIIFIAASICLSLNLIVVYIAVIIFINGSNKSNQNAKNYDIFFENFNEPSLIFLPNEQLYTTLIIVNIITISLIIGGICLIIFFSYTVSSNNKYSTTTTKMQKSLIISSIFQILISVLFYGLPICIACTNVIFEIENTSKWTCLTIVMWSVHCVLESIATLYFVLPYRRFIKKKLFRSSHVSTTKIHFYPNFTKIQ